MIDVREALAALLLGMVTVASAGCGDASRATATPPAPVVKVEPVVERDVPISVECVGTLVGYINTQIRARVAGHRNTRPPRSFMISGAGQQLLRQVGLRLLKLRPLRVRAVAERYELRVQRPGFVSIA